MPRQSKGLKAKENAKFLLEALLAFVNQELTDLSGVEIEANWQGKDADLFVKTELKYLANLTEKYKNDGKNLTTDQISAVLKQLEEFLQILEDKREKTQGAKEWKFVLKLWSTDKQRNLEFLEQEWEKRKSKSGGEKQTKSDTTIPTQKYNIPGEEWLDNKVFVGREKELAELHELLKNDRRVAVASVSGMGGVGKTELSRRYALAHKSAYPGGICWLEVPAENVGIQILRFAQNNLGLILPEDEDLLGRLRYCWQYWSGGEALLIYNDVTDYKSQVKPFLPPDSRFRVLLTTRKSFGSAFRELRLDVLKPLAAMELLKSILGREKVLQEPWKARELLKWLGYLPLAIELVGRYLDEYWESWNMDNSALTEMLQCLQGESLKHDAMSANELINYPHGVAEAIALSWKSFNKNKKKTQEIALRLGLYALAPIRFRLSLYGIEDYKEKQVWKIALGDLLNLNLLKEVESGVYSLHPLVREFLQIKLRKYPDADELKRGFVVAMVEAARKIPDDITLEQVEEVEVDIPHVAEVAENLTEYLSDDHLITPFVGLGRFYDAQGFYPKAQSWYEKCKEIAEQCLEGKPAVASVYIYLAESYRFQGKYNDAEPLYKQAIEIDAVAAFGYDLYLLAVAKLSNDKYFRLFNFYFHTLIQQRQIDKIALPENHLNLAIDLNNLALLYKSQGKYNDAELLYRQAIEINKITLPENHPELAQVLNNLGVLLNVQGRYEEAESLLAEALRMRKHLFGELHLNTAETLNNFGALYYEQGRYNKAKTFDLQVLEIRKQLLGEAHPSIAQSLNNLANLCVKQGYYEEAESLHLEALEMRKCFLGEEHPDIANSLNCMGSLYCFQGRYEEAEPLYQEALEMRKRLLGETHSSVSTCLNNLAFLYFHQKLYSKAETFSLQAIEIDKTALPPNHPFLARDLNNLANLYRDQGRCTEAENLYLQAIEIFEQKLGSEHSRTIKARENLELCRQQQ
ncbi:tetratricopeptide repeat protein [Dapis sp. BLCC M229]|uniref:tetratricopeptide repeat protein n=1 Tax=Dapis sp. BLCC M229 TaxID=3400188 RepID=UPI003CF59A31